MASQVPETVRMRVLLGGKSTQIGFVWLGILAWGFVAYMLAGDSILYSERATATTSPADRVETNGRVGYIVNYAFKDQDGNNQYGKSLAREPIPSGEHEVEYYASDSRRSRLVGTEQIDDTPENVNAGRFVFVMFLVLGLLFFAFELPVSIRTLRFLSRSQPATACVTGSSAERRKGRTWTKLGFDYDLHGETRTGSVERHDVPGLDVYKSFGIRATTDRVMTQFELAHGVMLGDGRLNPRDQRAYLFLLMPVAAAIGVVGLVGLLIVG